MAAAAESEAHWHWDDALLYNVAVDPLGRAADSAKEEGRAAGLRDGFLEGVRIGRTKGWEIGLELGYIHRFAAGILEGRDRSSGGGRYREGDGSAVASPPPMSDDGRSFDDDDHATRRPRTIHRLERCLALARDVTRLVEEFPDPDALLTQRGGRRGDQDTNPPAGAVVGRGMPALEPVNRPREGDGTRNVDGDPREEHSGEAATPLGSHLWGEVEGDNSIIGGLHVGMAETSNSNPEAAILDVSALLDRIRSKFKLLCMLLKTKQSFELRKVLELRDRYADDPGIDESVEGNDQPLGEPSDSRISRDGNLLAPNKGVGNLKEGHSSAVDSDW